MARLLITILSICTLIIVGNYGAFFWLAQQKKQPEQVSAATNKSQKSSPCVTLSNLYWHDAVNKSDQVHVRAETGSFDVTSHSITCQNIACTFESASYPLSVTAQKGTVDLKQDHAELTGNVTTILRIT